MEDRGLFTVIGHNLEQLTENLEVIVILGKKAEIDKTLLKAMTEIFERARLEEQMLRLRFELPPKKQERSFLDVLGDGITEAERPGEVVQRIRSSQELSRSLEEYFRFFNLKHISQTFRKLRFDLYGIERNIGRQFGPVELPLRREEPVSAAAPKAGSRIEQALADCPLYFILDESLCGNRDPLRVGYDAINGGVRMLQLRFKTLSDRELLDLARRLKHLCVEQECLLFINDRLDIALLSGADGIHVGATDLRVSDIKHLGPNLLVGMTARKPADAQEAQRSGAAYIGSGSVFSSKTKPGLPVIGLRGLSRITQMVSVPVVAIGGITLANCHKTLENGARGFCSIKPFVSRRSLKNLVAEFRQTCKAQAQA
ncbi:thiamine phosphate synthase [bacterium]|nr:thiamine phosphate synthase [bacterium]